MSARVPPIRSSGPCTRSSCPYTSKVLTFVTCSTSGNEGPFRESSLNLKLILVNDYFLIGVPTKCVNATTCACLTRVLFFFHYVAIRFKRVPPSPKLYREETKQIYV
jgi:hypothetical protein